MFIIFPHTQIPHLKLRVLDITVPLTSQTKSFSLMQVPSNLEKLK